MIFRDIFSFLFRHPPTFYEAIQTRTFPRATAANRQWKFWGIRRHERRAPAANILARLWGGSRPGCLCKGGNSGIDSWLEGGFFGGRPSRSLADMASADNALQPGHLSVPSSPRESGRDRSNFPRDFSNSPLSGPLRDLLSEFYRNIG